MGEAFDLVVKDGPRPENRAGLDASLLDLIAQDLLRFGERAPRSLAIIISTINGQAGVYPGSSDLPARLLAYVLDGRAPPIADAATRERR
jgi:hypothetical protein